MVVPQICETVTGATTAELRRRRDEVVGADLVELRLDSVADPDVAGALAGRRTPVIVTCRPTWEGGQFGGSEEERRRLLVQAIEAGAEYVDVEWRAAFDDLVARRQGRGIVLSAHDFNGVPDDLHSTHEAMRATGAEVVKIAVTARCLCDVFALESLDSGPGGAVFIAMGQSGFATRILAGRFGSRWTYTGDCAPGQVSTARLLDEFRVRDITASTAIYGVVGTRASTSLSPRLHNAAFAAGGVDAVYLPFETDDFDDFLAFADRLPVVGASVTMPFKAIAMRRAAETDEISRHVGAINTMRAVRSGLNRISTEIRLKADPTRARRAEGAWSATNTDVEGFLDPIRDVSLAGRRVAILGAGGAARAVAVAISGCGARVSVFARSGARAAAVAALARGEAFEGVPPRGSWDVLVNATPVGAAPDVDRTPIDADRLTGEVVYDLVYEPQMTRLLREARAAGCRTIGGLEMLIAQARRQSEWWTGRAPDEAVMRRALGITTGTHA